MAISISSKYTQRFYDWSGWKTVYSTKGSPFQYEDDGVLYTIWTYDADEIHMCQIWKETVPTLTLVNYSQIQNDIDKTDFETNYKSIGNLPLTQLDSDGASIVRMKAAKRGWTYFACPIEFSTSTLNSLYSKLSDGTNRSGITIKYYNGSGTEVTTTGLLNVNLATIVQTVVDFEPSYDYEIIGGELRIDQDITNIQDCRLYIIAAPDIPAIYGGSKEMTGGINLRYLAPQNTMVVDGRVSKFLTYNATTHTNKLRFILNHTIGLQAPIHITIDLYRQ